LSLSRKNILVAGMKEQGKTTLIVEMCKYIHAASKNKNHKVLFLMNSDPIPTANITRLNDYTELFDFCKQGKGIAKFYDGADMYRPLDDALQFLAKYFRNGILVIEDATPIMRGNITIAARDWYTNHKNRGVDLFTAYHTIDIPPYIAKDGGLTEIILFKTMPSYDANYINNTLAKSLNSKMPGYANEVIKAIHRVQKAKPTKNYIQPHEQITTGL
jgi:hypothetical protein